jgi:hypothetical protein
MWQRLGAVTLLGRTVASFAPEDQLHLLTIHGSKHLWERLAWVCDIAGILHASAAHAAAPSMRGDDGAAALDWERLLGSAREAGSTRMLFLGLMLARRLLDAPVPPEVERLVEAERGVQRLFDIVCRTSLVRPGAASVAMAPRFYLRLLDTPQRRLRFLAHLALDKLGAAWRASAAARGRVPSTGSRRRAPRS